jgi:cysteine desulfurase/selenocysteine lyase
MELGDSIRSQFPVFQQQPDIIFFDNASTTQKPTLVADAITQCMAGYAANAGRGTYPWASQVTQSIEAIRATIAHFIGADDPQSVVFTAGATDSINTIVYAWGLHNFQTGDEILYSPYDHAANVKPWQHLQVLLAKMNIAIKLVPYRLLESGEADLADVQHKLSSRTRLIVASHIHHVYGTKTDLSKLCDILPKRVRTAVDCSQSIGHIPIDVVELKADFVSFSGHKMFAGTGTGVLYIKPSIQHEMHAFRVGGNYEHHQAGSMPLLLETGTPNIVGIISIGAASEFITSIGIDAITARIQDLTTYALAKLRTFSKLNFMPGVAYQHNAVGYGILSFTINGMTSADVGFVLADQHIYVRTGNHCLDESLNSENSVRLSMHIYNTRKEIDELYLAIASIVNNL